MATVPTSVPLDAVRTFSSSFVECADSRLAFAESPSLALLEPLLSFVAAELAYFGPAMSLLAVASPWAGFGAPGCFAWAFSPISWCHLR